MYWPPIILCWIYKTIILKINILSKNKIVYIHGKQCQTLFFWAPKSLQMVTAAMKLKDAYSLEGKLWPT